MRTYLTAVFEYFQVMNEQCGIYKLHQLGSESPVIQKPPVQCLESVNLFYNMSNPKHAIYCVEEQSDKLSSAMCANILFLGFGR